MVDLRAQYLRIQEASTRRRPRGGEHPVHRRRGVPALRSEFAAFCGARYAVGVANGTDALVIALRASASGPATRSSPSPTPSSRPPRRSCCGARPVFVDVDEASFTMDPGALEARSRRARRRSCRSTSTATRRHGCHPGRRRAPRPARDRGRGAGARGRGRRAAGRQLGHAACFSFYPGKNLGAYGDAGAITTNDADFAARVRRSPTTAAGARSTTTTCVGANSRLDALQAAVLRAKLPQLERWTAERLERALAYTRLLEGAPGLVLPREQAWGRSAWHLYTLRVEDRDGLQAHLPRAGSRRRSTTRAPSTCSRRWPRREARPAICPCRSGCRAR